MMKKIGALVLALALTLSLTACGQKAEQTTVQEEPESGEASRWSWWCLLPRP